MILLFLFWIFGNVSIYTPETFLLTRTWQGKSVLANLLIPGCLFCLLRAGAQPDEKWPYTEAFLLALSSGLFTSMSPVLIFVFLAAGSVFTAVSRRRADLFMKFIPAMAAALIYIVLLLVV